MRTRRNPFSAPLKRRKRFSPLVLIGLVVSLVVALVGAAVFLLPHIATQAADANMDCTLIVPQNPLTAQGLATPINWWRPTPTMVHATKLMAIKLHLSRGQSSI